MPKPTSQITLLELGAKNYAKLKNYIGGLSDSLKHAEFPEGTLNRNIRDVLAHLHHWHLLFQGWHTVGMTGEKPHIPAEGYTWKTNADLNRAIREKYLGHSLEEIQVLLDESYQEMRNLILKYSDEELFEKKRYRWTGSTSLGAYLISATSSHYDWALKLIKKCHKNLA